MHAKGTMVEIMYRPGRRAAACSTQGGDDRTEGFDVNCCPARSKRLPMPTPAPLPATAGAADPLRVWFRFIRLHRRVANAISSELKAVGLSIPQFDLLSTLTEQEGLSQQELAERLYVTKGNVSGLLDRMVGIGLVERRAIPGDRRSNALHLTDKGRALAEQGIAVQRAYVARTLGALPPGDLADLERIVLAWRDNARLDEGEGAKTLQA
jgi:MarR family transcriptional regulator, organic hydroperoxide resistance regulator